MPRFLSLLLSLPLALAVPALHAEEGEQNRYNVLFIAVDDLRPELGCYGVEAAQTPNLDRLAAQSVIFDRHYVQVPTCGASRYALLTGRSPASSGVTRNNQALYSGRTALDPDWMESAQSLPELFRRSGYKTANIGKISHTADGRVTAYNGTGDKRPELPNAWDEFATPYGPWKRGWGIFFAYEGGRHREDGRGHRDLMEFTAKEDADLPDGLLREAAIEQLRKWKDERFFIGLGFFKPHLPFVAPEQDWQAMADVDVSPPANPDKPDSSYWHGSGEFRQYDFPFPKTRPLAPEDRVTARRAYLACVRYVDRQIGLVLDELDRLGLADNTIVVVWGDHGWHLGEQQIWGKHTPLERATRSVLMVRVPGHKPRRSDALVETIDLFPTLVDLCQPSDASTRHPLDGDSLAPILKGEADSVSDAAVSYWGNAISVRTDEYRAIYDGKDREQAELYTFDGDGVQSENLAEEKPEMVEKLRAHLPE